MDKLKQAIIEKIHGLPWEEARFKELEIEGCVITDRRDIEWLVEGQLLEVIVNMYDEDLLAQYTINGSPITLSRVLQALDNVGWYITGYGDDVNIDEGYFEVVFFNENNWEIELRWKLLKEDKSTATLEDQSEKTIETLKDIFLTK